MNRKADTGVYRAAFIFLSFVVVMFFGVVLITLLLVDCSIPHRLRKLFAKFSGSPLSYDKNYPVKVTAQSQFIPTKLNASNKMNIVSDSESLSMAFDEGDAASQELDKHSLSKVLDHKKRLTSNEIRRAATWFLIFAVTVGFWFAVGLMLMAWLH